MIQPQEIPFHSILCRFIQFHVFFLLSFYYNIDIVPYSHSHSHSHVALYLPYLELMFIMETLCFMFLWLHNFGAGERDVVMVIAMVGIYQNISSNLYYILKLNFEFASYIRSSYSKSISSCPLPAQIILEPEMWKMCVHLTVCKQRQYDRNNTLSMHEILQLNSNQK